MQSKWGTLDNKNSHEDKSIQKHVTEVKSKLHGFLEFYGFDQKYIEVADFLAEYHDTGKLHVNWYLGSREGHAQHSLEYIIENKVNFSCNKLDVILKFLILKHHSALSENVKDRYVELHGKRWSIKTVFNVLIKNDLESAIDSISFEEKVNLIDTFGLFKIADASSAGNKPIKFEKPKDSEIVVKKIISEVIDERWSEQIKLSALPDVSMLKAYTGWGKTNAGLLFFANKNVSKVFYLFPTITAINKFYEKIEAAVQDEVSKYFFFVDTEIKEEQEKLSNLFFIKNFISPYNLTTIDQFLLSFMQVGKYYTKRVMFKQAGIIVDEVHLLNPLMLDLLRYFINQYRQLYDLKVLFMSATLPKALAQYLQDNFKIAAFLDCSNGYEKKRRIMWKFEDEYIERHISTIVAEKRSGKKVLVIVNTVEKAIEIGKKLENEFGLMYDEDFIVFHARFMYKHRRKKEQWLELKRKQAHIAVTTQVCEVSLDISYDILFTELSSTPSIIQRFGRVNRYGDKAGEINSYIFKPLIRNPQRYPYSETELKIAEEIIRKFQCETLQNEKQLIDEMDTILSYEGLNKEIEIAKREVGMDYWEDILKFFYSFETKDDKLTKLLNYREGFTTLVIPHPNCLREKIREEVVTTLSKSFLNLPFEAREKLIAEIKEISVPVPIWWLKGIRQQEGIFPTVEFCDRIYDDKYGVHKEE